MLIPADTWNEIWALMPSDNELRDEASEQVIDLLVSQGLSPDTESHDDDPILALQGAMEIGYLLCKQAGRNYSQESPGQVLRHFSPGDKKAYAILAFENLVVGAGEALRCLLSAEPSLQRGVAVDDIMARLAERLEPGND